MKTFMFSLNDKKSAFTFVCLVVSLHNVFILLMGLFVNSWGLISIQLYRKKSKSVFKVLVND